jgi:mycothiol synthase
LDDTLLTRLRPFTWDDLESLAALGDACESVDQAGEVISVEMLRSSLSTPGWDPEKTVVVVGGNNGSLIASSHAVPVPGVVTDTIQVSARIHPDHRTSAGYAELLRDAEGRGFSLFIPTERPAEFQVIVRERPEMWRAVVESAGYQPVRWFIDMVCRVDGEIPDAKAPDGFSFRLLSEGVEPLALKSALDEAFMDHWNPPEFTDEQFLHWTQSPMFRSDLTLVALDSEGRVVGGAIGAVRDEYNAKTGAAEGRVEVLGVRRSVRGIGLGRALLAASLRLQKAAGMTAASLDVDADNPTGATRLYSSVGFTERDRMTVYSKPLPT